MKPRLQRESVRVVYDLVDLEIDDALGAMARLKRRGGQKIPASDTIQALGFEPEALV